VRRKLLIRASALTAALAIFALTWLAVGVRPWQAEAKALPDPRLPALQAREGRLSQEAEDVRQAVKERWATYRRHLRQRKQAIAAAERRHRRELRQARLAAAAAAAAASAPTIVAVSAPSVSVVSLPPVTQTRTS
jgi:hypothetical protein